MTIYSLTTLNPEVTNATFLHTLKPSLILVSYKGLPHIPISEVAFDILVQNPTFTEESNKVHCSTNHCSTNKDCLRSSLVAHQKHTLYQVVLVDLE